MSLRNEIKDWFLQVHTRLKARGSPYLFILVAEALGRGLKSMIASGCIQPFSLPRGALPVPFLSFADDLILFTRASTRSLSALFEFLSIYERASGQCINKHKSAFYVSKRCSFAQIQSILSISGIPAGTFPLRYLGCWLY